MCMRIARYEPMRSVIAGVFIFHCAASHSAAHRFMIMTKAKRIRILSFFHETSVQTSEPEQWACSSHPLHDSSSTHYSSERNYDLCCDSSRQFSLAPTIFFSPSFLSPNIFIIIIARLFVCNYISELGRIKCSKDHNCDSSGSSHQQWNCKLCFQRIFFFFSLHFSSKQLFVHAHE